MFTATGSDGSPEGVASTTIIAAASTTAATIIFDYYDRTFYAISSGFTMTSFFCLILQM